MATKQFAIPLDEYSIQDGDITFLKLVEDQSSVTFKLTNVVAGQTNSLNLITDKDGATKDHTFSLVVSSGTASVDLTAAQMASIYGDMGNGRDYIEAFWMVGTINTPQTSKMDMLQGGKVYDATGWPPKTH